MPLLVPNERPHQCLPAQPARIAAHLANGWYEHRHVENKYTAEIVAREVRSRGDHQALLEPAADGGYLVLVRARF